MECLRLGSPEHHYFLPNCSTQVETPKGKVGYQLNEHGFRAGAAATFEEGAFALLGDSKIEGWWVDQHQTVGARLEAKKIFGSLRELNLGIRYSGPTIQRMRLERAIENYPIKLILWFFNGSDLADEMLARSLALRRDKNGAPLALSIADAATPGWLLFLQKITGNKSVLLRSLQIKIYDREVTRLVLAQKSQLGPGKFCASFHSAVEIARKKEIPLIAVYLPLGPNIEKFPYMNIVGSEEGSEEIAACVNQQRVPLVDLREKLDTRAELYWSSLNRRGASASARE